MQLILPFTLLQILISLAQYNKDESAMSQQPWWRVRGIGVGGRVDGVERVEAKHGGNKDRELDPGIGGDGAEQECV